MKPSKPEYGELYGNIPSVRWGTGDKKMLIFAGGPGNTLPSPFVIRSFYREFDPFTQAYTLYFVTRKKGQPQGYSTRDMSNAYAEMIQKDFGGRVDVVIGVSFGGMIAQHFAADHPGLFDHIVIALAAHKVSETGRKIDTRFARLLSQGKTRSGFAALVDALYPPGISRSLYKAAFWLMGGILLGQKHETYENDVLVEAQAEVTHDALDSLARIKVPVLIICGGADVYFPREYVKEMAGLIQGASLKIYEGKGHVGALEDEAFAKDIFAFIGSQKA
ncbi:MAG: alpha/beta fold hydrolase [Chloroflexota bacterium]